MFSFQKNYKTTAEREVAWERTSTCWHHVFMLLTAPAPRCCRALIYVVLIHSSASWDLLNSVYWIRTAAVPGDVSGSHQRWQAGVRTCWHFIINLTFGLFKHKNWLDVPLSCRSMGFELPAICGVCFSMFHILFLKIGSETRPLIVSLPDYLVLCAGFWKLKL